MQGGGASWRGVTGIGGGVWGCWVGLGRGWGGGLRSGPGRRYRVFEAAPQNDKGMPAKKPVADYFLVCLPSPIFSVLLLFVVGGDGLLMRGVFG